MKTTGYRYAGLPVVISTCAPLHQLSDPDDNNSPLVDTLCMLVQNVIYVHPDRWELFVAILEKTN